MKLSVSIIIGCLRILNKASAGFGPFGVIAPAEYSINVNRKISQTVLTLPRGGEVHEPATLNDVEAILLKASTEGKLVVIDFSASWCGPCKMIAPFYHELSETDGMDSVVFLKVDVVCVTL